MSYLFCVSILVSNFTVAMLFFIFVPSGTTKILLCPSFIFSKYFGSDARFNISKKSTI